MATLLEKFAPQLQVADKYLEKNFGTSMSENTKLNTAVLINNTNKFMTMMESMNTQATERTNLGNWKKFCLNLTNIAVPSLIANDLVIVHAMTSFSGSVAYLEYQSRTNKGGVKRGDTFNSVFGLGKMDEARQNFTAETIVDVVVNDGDLSVVLSATPIEGALVDSEGKAQTLKVINADGVKFYEKASEYTPAVNDKVIYKSEEFQMTHVPAQDIPTIGPVMRQIPLIATPRRIAVRYDQITAYQAKTDYGFNLDKQIAEQAVGELNYEIDSEIVGKLYDAACESTSDEELESLTWSKVLPYGVSKFEHYNGFLEIFDKAQGIIYDRTQKFEANYMVCARDVLNVLSFVNGYTPVKGKKNGPYKAATLNGVDIYVSPRLASGEFFFGLNGSDMMSSAMVYAPYMAIVPTQLLGTPDGGLAQGFSTYYATAILNKNLVVRGKITNDPQVVITKAGE